MAIVEEWMFFNTFLVDLEETFSRWRLIESALPVCLPLPPSPLVLPYFPHFRSIVTHCLGEAPVLPTVRSKSASHSRALVLTFFCSFSGLSVLLSVYFPGWQLPQALFTKFVAGHRQTQGHLPRTRGQAIGHRTTAP